MELQSQIPVGIAPFTIIMKGPKAYVTNWGGRVPNPDDITGVTSKSNAVVDPQTGIGSSGTVSVVDLNTRTVVKEIEVGFPSASQIEFDFMRYRSLGKRLMGLRAVPVDGSAMTMATSIRRNWPFAFGILMVVPVLGWILAAVIAPILGIIEAVLVLTDDQGRRYGDRFANTKVIESKD